MGVTLEDIVEYRRIEARLDEAAARAHEVARVAQLSTSQHNTRLKGKAVKGAIAEARNHLRQLQEDEMRFQQLQQQIQEKRRMLEHTYQSEAEDLEDMESPPQRRPQDRIRSEVVRTRERHDHSEEDVSEGEHYRERREHH